MKRVTSVLARSLLGLSLGCPTKDQPAATTKAPVNATTVKDTRPTPVAVFVPVQPLKAAAREGSAVALQLGSGRFFSYALPQGWRVGEDGQFALTLLAPDHRAMTVMVGNAGVPPRTSPARFVAQKMGALQPQGLRLGPPRRAKPVAGFARAFEFDITYSARGIASRGVAKCSINTGYDSAVMAMTAAVSEVGQWPGYASWLPMVADQIAAKNGAAFGVRGVMAQNLRNSMAFADAARSYRDWSQRNWQQVTNDRNNSVDRQNTARREVLGGAKTYSHPYGENRTVELPLTYKHYWMDRQGDIVGTNDPSANPNQGATQEWRQVERQK